MAELTNEFSWSRSRDATFKECRRRYWYQYYGAWGGWEIRADPQTRAIYILKQLKSRQMWAGEVVHSCIQRSLENLRAGIEPLPVETILALALDQMRTEWKQSRDRVYRTRSRTTALFEHEYDVPITDAEWRANAAHVEACLRTFYRSDTYRAIHKLPRDRFLEIEDFSSFRIDGTRVHVKLDFACREEDRSLMIFDWKTGRRDDADNSIQLACYALYAHETWGPDPDSVRTVEFNLARDQRHEYAVSAADIERTRNYIRGSIRDMRELLRDPAGNTVDSESCPLTTELWRCRNCNFKRLCGR